MIKNTAKIGLMIGSLLVQWPSFMNGQESKIPDEVFADQSTHKNDYVLAAWVRGENNPYVYDIKKIPEKILTDAEKTAWTGKKNGFVISIFEKEKEVARYTFPASLLKTLELKKIKILMFMPRSKTKSGLAGWDHEFLAIEGGRLVIYRVWVEKDSTTGKVSRSVDFGTRRELADNVDASSVVAFWEDGKKVIYFKDIDGKWWKWDETKEAKETARKPFKKAAPATWAMADKITKNDTGFSFKVGKQEYVVSFKDQKTKKIDPLKVDLKTLMKPFKNLGTTAKPVKGIPEKLEPGQALVLKELLEKGEKIIFDQEISADEYAEFVQLVNTTAKLVNDQSKVTVELKLRMREKGGIKAALLKEVKASPADDAAKKAEAALKTTLLESPEAMKKAIDKLMAVKDLSAKWFDKDNKDIGLKVLITYLTMLEPEDLKDLFTKHGVSGIKSMNVIRTIYVIGKNSDIIRREKKAKK